MTEPLRPADYAFVVNLLDDFHPIPSGTHASFTDSIALTHCICFGAACRTLARVLQVADDHGIGETLRRAIGGPHG